MRLTTFKHAATSVLMPALPAFLDAHPDVRVEITVDDALTDIVAGRFDAGVRFGERVEKDMIAVRVGPDVRSAIVGVPAYFARRPASASPRDPAGHRCIGHRRVIAEDLYPWMVQHDGRPIQVRIDGPLVFNDSDLILAAALAGQGLAYLFEDQVAVHVAAGRLVRAMADWCTTSPGCYLYHPSRRQTPPALAALVDALRFKPATTER